MGGGCARLGGWMVGVRVNLEARVGGWGKWDATYFPGLVPGALEQSGLRVVSEEVVIVIGVARLVRAR